MLLDNSWPTVLNTDIVPVQTQTVQAKMLVATIDRLESERESLVNTISDLRLLLQRVAAQQEREASRRQASVTAFKGEIDRLKKALDVSEKYSAHFSDMAEFWRDNIE